MADCTLCEPLGIVCSRKEGFMGFGETRTAIVQMRNGKTRKFPELAPILDCEVVNETMTPEEAAEFLKSSTLDFRKLY